MFIARRRSKGLATSVRSAVLGFVGQRSGHGTLGVRRTTLWAINIDPPEVKTTRALSLTRTLDFQIRKLF